MRALYRCVVALHPAAFRSQFGAEMEFIFDECGRPPRLLADIWVSLVRQWVLRTQLWIFFLAGAGGLIPFLLAMGFARFVFQYFGVAPVHRHAHKTAIHAVSPPVTEPFIMMTAVTALLLISGATCLTIAWFRHSQKVRERPCWKPGH